MTCAAFSSSSGGQVRGIHVLEQCVFHMLTVYARRAVHHVHAHDEAAPQGSRRQDARREAQNQDRINMGPSHHTQDRCSALDDKYGIMY